MTEEPLPDRRKHGYIELEEKLERHVGSIEDRLRRFYTKALAAFAVIGIASAIALLGYGLVLNQQKHTSDEIQQQRYDSLLQSCVLQNQRHDRAIERAKILLPRDRRTIVLLLVDELQPREADCEEYARNRVNGNF